MRSRSAVEVTLKILGITSLVGIASCTSSTPSVVATGVDEYRIAVGDNLCVKVRYHAGLSIVARVRPDGKISVPLAGDVDVDNKTPEEVSATVTERLAVYVRDPYVTVTDTAVENPCHQEMTELDLLLEAGGVTKFRNLPDRNRAH